MALSASTPQQAGAPAVAPVRFDPLPDPAGWLKGASLPGPFPAEVTEVVDGDTIEARVTIWLGQEVTTRIRLRGIDAPERASDCPEERRRAEAATQVLARLVGNGAIRLTAVGKDKYGGRVLAEVHTADHGSINAAMLASGHARPYQGGRREAWCGPALSARR